MYVYIYIYTHIYTYIHIYIHTQNNYSHAYSRLLICPFKLAMAYTFTNAKRKYTCGNRYLYFEQMQKENTTNAKRKYKKYKGNRYLYFKHAFVYSSYTYI